MVKAKGTNPVGEMEKEAFRRWQASQAEKEEIRVMPTRRAKRNTYIYELLGKYGKVLYRGRSKTPKKRVTQHKREGKRFKAIRINPFPCSEKTAHKREKKSIKTYKRTHGGKRPKYNKIL